jgi:hypothetical protein
MCVVCLERGLPRLPRSVLGHEVFFSPHLREERREREEREGGERERRACCGMEC